MEDWKEYKLGDIGTIVGGATPSTKDSSNYDGNIAWITPKDLSNLNCRYISHGERMISQKGFDDCSCRMLPKNSILFSSRAPIGYVAIAQNALCTNQGFKSIIPNNEIVDSLFLYYLLVYYKPVIENMGSGTTFKEVSGSVMKALTVNIPNIDEQKRIAAILSSLDDKIELNRRINGNLEQQVQALYAKAFSSTNTCKMGDVVETTSGGTPSRKNQNYFSSQGIKWIKSKELNGSFIFDSEEHISNDGLCNSSAKLLPPNSTLIAMYGATVGAYGLTIDNATCNQAICALLPNSQYPYTYLYMWAKNNKDELIQKAIGSAQQNISQIIIKNMPVANEKDKIIRFDSDTRYIFSLMKSLAKENYNLIALRDALLPRLMSGELKINDLNR